MKQHGIFFGVFGALYLVWTRVSERFAEPTDRSPRSRSRRRESALILPSTLDLVPPNAPAPERPSGVDALLKELGLFAAGMVLPTR